MKKIIYIILILSVTGCISRSKIGMENERCFDDQSCLNGLVCNEEFICVKRDNLPDVISDVVVKDISTDSSDAISEYCKGDNDCSNPERTYCDTERNICVQCRNSGDCPSNLMCINNICVQDMNDGGTDTGGYCVIDLDCKDSGRPHCDTERNICVACRNTDDCTSPHICVNNICVEETEDAGTDVSYDAGIDAGGCGSGCGANAECISGLCVCNSPYLNCNGDWADGCEVDGNNDINNCGGCDAIKNMKCINNANCVSGKYSYECSSYCIDEDKAAWNGCEKWNYFPRKYSGMNKIIKLIPSPDGYVFIAANGNYENIFGEMNRFGEILYAYNVTSELSDTGNSENIYLSDVIILDNNNIFIAGYSDERVFIFATERKPNNSQLSTIYFNCGTCKTLNLINIEGYLYVAVDKNDKLIIRVSSTFGESMAKKISAAYYFAGGIVMNAIGELGIYAITKEVDTEFLSYFTISPNLSQINSSRRILLRDDKMNDLKSNLIRSIYKLNNKNTFISIVTHDYFSSNGYLFAEMQEDMSINNSHFIKATDVFSAYVLEDINGNIFTSYYQDDIQKSKLLKYNYAKNIVNIWRFNFSNIVSNILQDNIFGSPSIIISTDVGDMFVMDISNNPVAFGGCTDFYLTEDSNAAFTVFNFSKSAENDTGILLGSETIGGVYDNTTYRINNITKNISSVANCKQ